MRTYPEKQQQVRTFEKYDLAIDSRGTNRCIDLGPKLSVWDRTF